MPPEQEQQSFKSPTVIPTPDKSQIVHGIKDACADNALWLVSSVVQYIKETGELGFADEMITYADGGEGTVYEHMRRILDFSARQIGRNGICKGLNAPCYTKPDDGIGFVTRVYPGLKENGAIFSHPNPWAWCAEAVLGRGSRAMKFYNALCPALQNDKIEIRQSEPYSYCPFVVGRSHTAFGRARHPFMTGSAGWAYYAATQYILGVRPEFDCLRVDPCVPADWKEFSVTRKWRGGVYNIHVVNPDGVEKGVREIIADGRKVDALPVIPAGNICNAEIIMG